MDEIVILRQKIRALQKEAKTLDTEKIREYAAKFKQARRDQNLNQEQAADYLLISRPQFSNMETGRYGMTLSNFVKLCELYKLSADDVLWGKSA